MPCHVAVFDLDGTLTRRDTSLPFLRSAVGGASVTVGVASAALMAIPDLRRAHLAESSTSPDRLGSIYGRWEGLLHQRVVIHCLEGMRRERLDEAAIRFSKMILAGRLRPEAERRIEAHRAQGHRLVLASASLEVVLAPLARALGFDLSLGTRLDFKDGVTTGRFVGLPCWGLEKLRRVRDAAAPWGEATLHAYGDSSGDGPLLRSAHHAYRVG